MATLKETLETKLVDPLYIGRNLFREATSDDKRKKHFKVKTTKIEEGSDFDVHECVITIVSDKEVSELIHKMNMIRILRRIEEPFGHLNETSYPHIVKVIDVGSSVTKDKSSIDIVFHIINNIER